MMALTAAALTKTDLIDEALRSLRSEPSLTSLLGDPARIFDGETEAASYPYVVLERYECVDTSVSEALCTEHRLQFATLTDHGGQGEAKRLLNVLRLALQRLELNLVHQRVVLIHPTYSDVMRTRNPRFLRGILRARIHTEEI